MIRPLLTQRRFYLPFILYWVVWVIAEVRAFQWYGFPYLTSLWDALITFGLLAVTCLIIINILTYYQPGRDIILSLGLIAGIAAILWVFADRWLLHELVYPEGLSRDLMDKSMPVRFCIGFLNVGLAIVITLFWKQAEGDRESGERKNALEKTARESELYKLRQQLHPHLLFNSLNSINALIHSRPDEARKMVQQLSEFLRGTLKREEKEFISLEEELRYLKLYLDIEKVRFGHRLKTVIEVTNDALACTMPPLLLQPLMENAIKFGLYGTTGDVSITLRAHLADHYLTIAIMNPYDPDMQMPQGTGFGLKSIRRRLFLLFGRNDLLEINQGNNVFVIIFRIPQSHDKDNHH